MSEEYQYYTDETRTRSSLSRDLEELLNTIGRLEQKIVSLSSEKEVALLKFRKKRIELQELEDKCHSKS